MKTSGLNVITFRNRDLSHLIQLNLRVQIWQLTGASDRKVLARAFIRRQHAPRANMMRYALRKHMNAITSGDFLSERHIDSIPITVHHVTAASAIVTREEDVCLCARLSRLNS